MGIAQIVILIVGAILFTISFFIPERTTDNKKSREQEEKLVKEIVEQEVNKFKFKLEEAAEDTVANSREKTQRNFERITNEKMMAISEYSDTVMEQIHKNHEEAMFLYDMLNNKHVQVKNTVAEINQISKSIRRIPEETKEEINVADSNNTKDRVSNTDSASKESVNKFEPITPERIVIKETKKKEEQKETAKKKGKTKIESDSPKEGNTIEIMFDSDSSGMNNNDKILALHKSGKSNMAIAKELGLGIGEVKLVIDLFEGI